jgi:hypothetical protein
VRASFADFRPDFLRLTTDIVWCSLTTLDRHNRPRSRIVHPIWEVADDQPIGWLATRRSPVKTAHLAHSPHVACVYWRPSHDAVLLQCLATWEDGSDHKARIWDLFKATPPPLGYDPGTIWSGGPADPDYSLLRLDPWRVQIVTVETLASRRPRVWTAPVRPSMAVPAPGATPEPSPAAAPGPSLPTNGAATTATNR